VGGVPEVSTPHWTHLSFCESVGLPTTLAEMGLPEVSEDDLKRVAMKTIEKDNSAINEPVPLREDSILYAIKAADNEGRIRKKIGWQQN